MKPYNIKATITRPEFITLQGLGAQPKIDLLSITNRAGEEFEVELAVYCAKDKKPMKLTDYSHLVFDDKEKSTEPKYRYENVTDSIFDLKEDLDSGNLYSENKKGKYYQINGETWLVSATDKGNVYRRVEISERDLFIEAYAWATQDDKQNIEDIAGMLFDSGKFKLVD